MSSQELPKKVFVSSQQAVSRESLIAGSSEQAIGKATDNNWAHPITSNANGAPSVSHDVRVRWNQAFPYQLLVVEIGKDHGGNRTYKAVGGWKYTLPIPPERMSIQMPFAIDVAATLDGIIEEGNGAPFRIISFSGTTGVLPGKGNTIAGSTFSLNHNETINGGNIFYNIASDTLRNTVGQAQRTFDAAKATARSVIPSIFSINNIIKQEDIKGSELGINSGYVQFLLLQAFLENYAAFRKTKAGKNYVLAFANWKDTKDSVYLCTPVSFSLERHARTPYEYPYSLVLKAWRRVKLSVSEVGVKNVGSLELRSNKIASVLTTLIQARRTITAAKGVLSAIISDAKTLFDVVNEAIFLAKDTVGLVKAIADFPEAIKNEMISEWNNVGQNASEILSSNDASTVQAARELNTATPKASNNIKQTHPGITKMRDDLSVGESISPDDMNISTGTRQKMEAYTDELRFKSQRPAYYEEQKRKVIRHRDAFEEMVGLGTETFNKTYGNYREGSGFEPVTKKQPTNADIELSIALNDIILSLEKMAVLFGVGTSPRLEAIDYVAGLASSNGIAFQRPVSKFAIPFPYGSSLESLAERYLGDKDRWHEIATLNGLKSPYVDEVGFKLNLLANGYANEIVVESKDNFFVNQPVYISSKAVHKEKRRVRGIRSIGPSQYVILLDGEPDLNKYKVIDNAYVEGFLPGTVNSHQLIYIPSQSPSQFADSQLVSIPGVNHFEPIIAVAGYDMMLNDQNDIFMTNTGESRLALGMQGLIQRARIIVGTKQGTVLGHPDFGIPIDIGQSVADKNASEILKAAQAAFADDPSFASIRSAGVDVKGPVARIALSLEVAGISELIPVGFDIKP